MVSYCSDEGGNSMHTNISSALFLLCLFFEEGTNSLQVQIDPEAPRPVTIPEERALGDYKIILKSLDISLLPRNKIVPKKVACNVWMYPLLCTNPSNPHSV